MPAIIKFCVTADHNSKQGWSAWSSNDCFFFSRLVACIHISIVRSKRRRRPRRENTFCEVWNKIYWKMSWFYSTKLVKWTWLYREEQSVESDRLLLYYFITFSNRIFLKFRKKSNANFLRESLCKITGTTDYFDKMHCIAMQCSIRKYHCWFHMCNMRIIAKVRLTLTTNFLCEKIWHEISHNEISDLTFEMIIFT